MLKPPSFVLVGCPAEVIVLDGDGGTQSGGGGVTEPVSGCPLVTDGIHCPTECPELSPRVDPNSSNYCTFACDRATPTGCPAGYVCKEDKCFLGPCGVNYLCPPDFGCISDGLASPSTHCAPVAHANSRDSQCRMHPASSAPCEAACDRAVTLGGTGYCTNECEDDLCAVGFGCSTAFDELICLPQCFTDDDCPSGLHCGDSGLCDIEG